jgi:hypothetical protein
MLWNATAAVANAICPKEWLFLCIGLGHRQPVFENNAYSLDGIESLADEIEIAGKAIQRTLS